MPEATPWQLLALPSASTSTQRRLEHAPRLTFPFPTLCSSSPRRKRDATETLAGHGDAPTRPLSTPATRTLSNRRADELSSELPDQLKKRSTPDDASFIIFIAGTAAEFLQFRPTLTFPGHATASVGFTVSSQSSRDFPSSPSSTLAKSTMRARAPRRHCRLPPRTRARLEAPERAFDSSHFQLANAQLNAPNRAL